MLFVSIRRKVLVLRRDLLLELEGRREHPSLSRALALDDRADHVAGGLPADARVLPGLVVAAAPLLDGVGRVRERLGSRPALRGLGHELLRRLLARRDVLVALEHLRAVLLDRGAGFDQVALGGRAETALALLLVGHLRLHPDLDLLPA